MTRAVVDSLGSQGDGILSLDGEVLHVPKVLPGELVEIVEGKLKRVIKPSAQRVTPFCRHFEKCGGCRFQHWEEGAYGEWKRHFVIDAMQRYGITTEVAPLIDAHGKGRRRVVLHVRELDGIWQSGFMQAKSHLLTALDQCPVLETGLQNAIALAASFGPILGPCDVSITNADNGLDVAVKSERSAAARRLPALQQVFNNHHCLRYSINGEVVLAPNQPEVQIGKARVRLPLSGFLQATRQGENVLAERVTTSLKKSKLIVDLFCGVGPFALRLAEHARIHAVDADKLAVEALQSAARNTQGLKPVTTEARDLFRNPLVPQELNGFDGAVLNPPRAGAEAQARSLAKSKIRRVAMVSCDAETFARDASILLQGGYRLGSVTPVDQFKWTAHVEIVAGFQR